MKPEASDDEGPASSDDLLRTGSDDSELIKAAKLGQQLLQQKQELTKERDQLLDELRQWQEVGDVLFNDSKGSTSAAEALKEAGSLREKVAGLQRASEGHSAKIIEHETHCAELEGMNEVLQSELNSRLAEIEALTQREARTQDAATIKAGMLSLQSELTETRQQLSSAQDKVRVLEADCKQYQEELGRAQALLEHTKAAQLKAERGAMQTPKKGQQEEEERQDQENILLTKQLEESWSIIEELKLQLAASKIDNDRDASRESVHQLLDGDSPGEAVDQTPSAQDPYSIEAKIDSDLKRAEEQLESEFLNLRDENAKLLQANNELSSSLAESEKARHQLEEVGRFLEQVNLDMMTKLEAADKLLLAMEQRSEKSAEDNQNNDEIESNVKERMGELLEGIPEERAEEIIDLWSNAIRTIMGTKATSESPDELKITLVECFMESHFLMTLVSVVMASSKLMEADVAGTSLLGKANASGVPFFEWSSWIRAQLRQLPAVLHSPTEVDQDLENSIGSETIGQLMQVDTSPIETKIQSGHKSSSRSSGFGAWLSSSKQAPNKSHVTGGGNLRSEKAVLGPEALREMCLNLTHQNMALAEKYKKSLQRRKALELALEVEQLEKEEESNRAKAIKQVCDLLSNQLAESEAKLATKA